jgi:hypothetical protein
MACYDACRLKLSQNTVNGSEPHVFAIGKKHFIDFLGTQMPFATCQKEV